MANLLDQASIVLTPTAYDNGKVLCAKPSEAPYGDFDFSRNSAATRVNAQGLVENVQILSSNLVQNGDFSEEGVQEVSNGSFTNGSTDWTLGTGWSIGEDKASSDGSVAANSYLISTGNTLTIGKTYKVQYTVLDYIQGNVRVRAGQASSIFVNADGTYTEYMVATSTESVRVQANSNFIGSITNISVKEVGMDWVIENVWTITDGVANGNGADGTSEELTQGGVTTSGKTYSITYEIKNYVSGSIKTRRPNSSFNSGNGIYTELVLADATTLTFTGANFIGSITNISVIEITDDTSLPRINYEGFSYQDTLGSEEIVNGNFSNGSTDWSTQGNSDIEIGNFKGRKNVAKININNTSTGSRIAQPFNYVLGKSYKVEIDVYVESGSFRADTVESYVPGDFVSTSDLGYWQTLTGYITATRNGVSDFWLRSISQIATFYVANVSVKEYSGQEVVPNSGCGSWLFEPQSTNLIPYSEDFSQWIASGGSEVGNSSSVVSPSNSNNIGIITGTIGTGAKFARINVITSSSIITYSAFFKYNSHQWVQFASGGTSEYANFDIQNGVVGNKLSGTTSTIDNFGNGWYRCTLSTSVASTPSNMAVVLIDTATSSRLDDTSSVGSAYVWGAQLEQQSYATSYIPTENNPNGVSRNQDVCNNGGSLATINSTSGTLYFEGSTLVNGGQNRYISLSNNTSSNRLQIIFHNNSNRLSIGMANPFGSVSSINDFSFVQTNNNKIAVSYSALGLKLFVNGILKGSNTDNASFTPNTLTTLDFALWNQTSSLFQGKTKALAVWKEALSDQELVDLTYPTPTDPTFTLDFDTIAEQFTFARGSEATYVDAQGLIQSTNEIGEELITNGDFSNGLTDWSVVGGSYASVNNGILNSNNTLNGSWFGQYIAQDVSFVNGKKYKLTFKAKNISGNTNLRLTQGGNVIFSSNITSSFVDYEVFYTANADNNSLRLFCNDAIGEFAIDNVSVKEYITETNTPRLDYSTGAEAFLLEPQSTNLITYSSDFSNSSWTKFGNTVVTPNTVISPDGTLNASTVTGLSGTGSNDLRYVKNGSTANNTYTYSVYLKGSGTVRIQLSNGIDQGFDDTITLTSSWKRHFLTSTFNSTTTPNLIANLDDFNSQTATQFDIWGAQLEQQSYATSYIPTSGTTVTRNQETCINATPEINSEEGVLYAEIAALADDLSNRMISLSDSDSSNHVRIYYTNSTNKISVAVKSNGSNQYIFLNHNVTDITNFIKIAVKYKANDFATFINGVEVNSQTTTASTPIGLDRLNFDSGAGATSFYGKTKDLQVYTKALSDAELIKLTT